MGPVRSLALSGADTLLCGDDGNNLKAFVRFVAAARSQRSVLLLIFKLSVECLSWLIVFNRGGPTIPASSPCSYTCLFLTYLCVYACACACV